MHLNQFLELHHWLKSPKLMHFLLHAKVIYSMTLVSPAGLRPSAQRPLVDLILSVPADILGQITKVCCISQTWNNYGNQYHDNRWR